MQIDMEKAVGPSGAGRILGVTRERVLQLLREGKLQAIRTPIGHLFDLADVERLAEERRREAAERSH